MGFLRELDRKLSRLNEVAYRKLPHMFLGSEGVHDVISDSGVSIFMHGLTNLILARNFYNVTRKRAFGLGPFVSSDLRKAKQEAKKNYRKAVKDLNVTILDGSETANHIWDNFYENPYIQYTLVLARFSASPFYFLRPFFEKYLRIFRLYLEPRKELTPLDPFMLLPIISDIRQTIYRIDFKNHLNLIDSSSILSKKVLADSLEIKVRLSLLVILYSIPSILYYLINPFSFIRKTLEAGHQITLWMTKFPLFRIPIDGIALPLRFAVSTMEACVDSFWSLTASTLSFILSPVTFLMSAAWQTLRHINLTFVTTDTHTLQSLKIMRKISKNGETLLKEKVYLEKLHRGIPLTWEDYLKEDPIMDEEDYLKEDPIMDEEDLLKGKGKMQDKCNWNKDIDIWKTDKDLVKHLAPQVEECTQAKGTTYFTPSKEIAFHPDRFYDSQKVMVAMTPGRKMKYDDALNDYRQKAVTPNFFLKYLNENKPITQNLLRKNPKSGQYPNSDLPSFR